LLFAGVWCILGSMETKVVKVDAVKPDAAKIKETAELVERGGLVGFPPAKSKKIQSQNLIKSNKESKISHIRCISGKKTM